MSNISLGSISFFCLFYFGSLDYPVFGSWCSGKYQGNIYFLNMSHSDKSEKESQSSLISVSLIVKVEYIFKYLWVICVPSFKNYLFNVLGLMMRGVKIFYI